MEINFQNRKKRTQAVEGPHPQWNETISIPLDIFNETVTHEKLHSIQDIVNLNVYDEYYVDLSIDERDRDSKIHRRKEKNWLATLAIPFSTIYKCNTVWIYMTHA